MLRRWIPQTYFLLTIYTRIPSAVTKKPYRPAEVSQRPSDEEFESENESADAQGPPVTAGCTAA